MPVPFGKRQMTKTKYDPPIELCSGVFLTSIERRSDKTWSRFFRWIKMLLR